MNMQEIRQIAQSRGMKTGRTGKEELVRRIQIDEGNFACFGERIRLSGSTSGAGFRIRSPDNAGNGTICATGVSRSSTVMVSPRRTARRYFPSLAFSSEIRTCLMTL